MSELRKLTPREKSFKVSLQRHGFRYKKSKKNLKENKGYVIPSTKREDASGIDFWIKLPKETELIPIQVTQRGTRLYRKFQKGEYGRVIDC